VRRGVGQGAGGGPGGIEGLIALVGEHADAIRSDLHRFHRLRLTDVGGPLCTWGELRAYLTSLPPEAALWRSLGSPRQWGWAEHMLAGAVHATQSGNWQRGGGKGPRPKPLKAPGIDQANERTFGTALSIDEMRHVLDTWSDPPEPGVLLGPDGNPLEVNDGD
jgi:hypothetical protein